MVRQKCITRRAWCHRVRFRMAISPPFRAPFRAAAPVAASGEQFEFPPHRPDQALLGCRRGPMKNKSNDPAAITPPKRPSIPRKSIEILDLTY
jgi:hypothetical protein